MIASGYQIMVRQKAARRPLLENIWHIFPVGAPIPKTLTEISGQSGTGKSLFLYHTMARAVAPKQCGGKSCKLIFIDANHKNGINNFKKCLVDVMSETDNDDVPLLEESVLKNCLDSVIYLPCYSAEHFDLALEDIDDLLWDNENVSLLAIDGIDSFYWEDCYSHLVRMSTHYKKLCQRVKSFCQEHNICCIYTVDTNYLQPKCKGSSSQVNPLLDYKFTLVKDINGERHLNDKPFCITDSGAIKFLK